MYQFRLTAAFTITCTHSIHTHSLPWCCLTSIQSRPGPLRMLQTTTLPPCHLCGLYFDDAALPVPRLSGNRVMSNFAPPHSPIEPSPLARRSSIDFRNGGMNGGQAMSNMNGNGVPMPMAPHSRASSGQYPVASREYAAMGGGAFVGARSPPKTKSRMIWLRSSGQPN